MSLAPAAFYELTYAELTLMLEGYTARVKRHKHDLAWVVANLLQPHLKEGVTLTPEDLLGTKPERRRKRKPHLSAEQAADLMLKNRKPKPEDEDAKS